MSALGVGEILGGIFTGYMIDRYGNKNTVYCNLLSIVVQTVVALAYITIDEYSWLAYAMTFTWGWQDNAINTHISEVMGFEFDNSS
jgi:predicted MFS family arabinose efflux permease